MPDPEGEKFRSLLQVARRLGEIRDTESLLRALAPPPCAVLRTRGACPADDVTFLSMLADRIAEHGSGTRLAFGGLAKVSREEATHRRRSLEARELQQEDLWKVLDGAAWRH